MSSIGSANNIVGGPAELELFASVWSVIVAARTELLLFVAAMVAYKVLFWQKMPMNPKQQAKKKNLRDLEQTKKEDAPPAVAKSKQLDTKGCAEMERALEAAFERSDHRAVLNCWVALKKSRVSPAVSLPHVVESMQRLKKETPAILLELKDFFKAFPGDADMTRVNDLLDSLAKRLDSGLMEQVVEMLPSLGQKMNERSYEIFLAMFFTTSSFQEIKSLVSQMKAAQIPFTVRSSMTLIKAALKRNDLDEAMQYLKEMKKQGDSSSLSMAPTHVISQLIELACKEHRLQELIDELHGLSITEEMVNTMFSESGRQKSVVLADAVENFARGQDVHFSDITYGLLIRMAADQARAYALFDEAIRRGVEMTAELAGSVLAFCVRTSDVELADKLYEHMLPQQLPVLTSFIRFYAESEQYEKACDVYERDLLRLHGNSEFAQPVRLDSRAERSLMKAAMKCERGHLAKNMLSTAPSDIGKHITMIRSFAAEQNLPGAKSVFESLEQSGVDMNSVMYNTVLDACVACRDLKAAEAWMERTRAAGMADVVSFNTLIKAHLQNGSFDKARRLMEEMKKNGLQPNRVTFNELINAMVSGGDKGRSSQKDMWSIVREMKDADVKPNQVTISILLKNLNYYSASSDIANTMDLIDAMDEPMDEVLLSSIVEACVRIGKPDLLESKLKQLQKSSMAVSINGSHTYGSLIKAYGYAKDIGGVWRCWKEMRSRHIKPTSVTLGCMVEAVVSLGDPEGAFDLIHQVQDDAQCCTVLNSVIYCSVLKGFTREKRIDRVWAVYEEMSNRKLDQSIVIYNTLIDACARCGRMERLPKILEDMKSHSVNPNVITYSTMLKGHCQNGDMQKGFAILEQMKQEANLKPDEIMYNSLLDGCAQNNLVDEGLRLLQQMQNEGVSPSNFTLSILVKLMNRVRKLEQAFSLVEDITQKYKFRPNVHVYTNLIQACVSSRQLPRGMGVLEQMVKEKVAPDGRTYATLIRASISSGSLEQAAGLLSGALGFSDALPFLRQSIAVCRNLETPVISEALVGLVDRGRAQDLAVPLLSKLRQEAPKVRIDEATQRKVMTGCMSSAASGVHSSQEKKGKGFGRSDRQ